MDVATVASALKRLRLPESHHDFDDLLSALHLTQAPTSLCRPVHDRGSMPARRGEVGDSA